MNWSPSRLVILASITSSVIVGQGSPVMSQGTTVQPAIEVAQVYSHEGAANPTAFDITNGLVAYFPLDGDGTDATGNGHDGTLFGVTATSDRFGNPDAACAFDGNDYIAAPADGLPGGERTVALWFRMDALGYPVSVLLGYGGNSCGTTWFQTAGPGTLGRYSHCDVQSTTCLCSPGTGVWCHWAITTSSEGTRMYMDGEPVFSSVDFIGNTWVDGRQLAIGVDVNPSGYAPYTDSNVTYTHGAIDEVRIYNRALSPEEVLAVYHEGDPVGIKDDAPHVFRLHLNHPNPFNPSTTIRYELSSRTRVSLSVFDVRGQKVKDLVDQVAGPGLFTVEWDGTNARGEQVSTGVYFYRLDAGRFSETRRMVLLK